MTYSIIAFDKKTDTIGVAAATGNLLVGQFVPHCVHGIGAVASQGRIPDPSIGIRALIALGEHGSVQHCFSNLQNSHLLKQDIQLTVMNMQGDCQNYSGDGNLSFSGAICEDALAVSGNWLKSAEVLEAMTECYHQNKHMDLAQRLIACLEAAYQAGSDVRGTFSAAIKTDNGRDLPLDLRVDYHASPIEVLKKIYARWQSEEYQSFLQSLEKNSNSKNRHLQQILRDC